MPGREKCTDRPVGARALLAWAESSFLASGAFALGLTVLQSGFGEFGF